MSVTWAKEQRQRAENDGHSLFYVAIDGRTNAKGKIGKYEYSGPIPDEGAVEVFKAVQKIVGKYKAKAQ